MSAASQKVLIMQHASRELDIIPVRNVLRKLSLNCGDKVKLLGIIEAFTTSNTYYLPACLSLLKSKTKLQSSVTINKRKEDIEEAIQEKLDQYSNCDQLAEILKITETIQVQFEIAVEAGLLKEIAVEYAKSFQATHLVLPRRLKKEVKYFMKNLSCGISRVKKDNSIEFVRLPETNEVVRGQETTSDMETWDPRREPLRNLICSLCMMTRPWIGQMRKFTYAQLKLATNGFSTQNLYSDHGRKIYLALLNDQRKVMVREHPSSTIKEEEFKMEVQILEKLRHENVAIVIGSCSEGSNRLLVYEYICNGSLNKHLSNQSRKLTWESRISIAAGAAKGLEYLHGERIYGSIMPGNILLTHDYQPLISYYGVGANQYEALGSSSGSTVLNAFQYLAPEYEESGIDMSKAEVYSFGVVLLELITGRKTKDDTDSQSFLRWARPLLMQKKYMELIDPILQESVDLHQLFWMVLVAEACLSWDPKERCSINKVVRALADISNHCSVEDFSLAEFEVSTRTAR